jgi:hypothetical protein
MVRQIFFFWTSYFFGIVLLRLWSFLSACSTLFSVTAFANLMIFGVLLNYGLNYAQSPRPKWTWTVQNRFLKYCHVGIGWISDDEERTQK